MKNLSHNAMSALVDAVKREGHRLLGHDIDVTLTVHKWDKTKVPVHESKDEDDTLSTLPAQQSAQESGSGTGDGGRRFGSKV